MEGTWKALTENVNGMATNLTTQVRSIASVTTAVAEGNLSRKIEVEARGEILQLKDTINKMVERLQNFATEVTKVAREVGTDGILGGQAKVQDVEGTWKDLTDNVNSMFPSPVFSPRNANHACSVQSWPTTLQLKCGVLQKSQLPSLVSESMFHSFKERPLLKQFFLQRVIYRGKLLFMRKGRFLL